MPWWQLTTREKFYRTLWFLPVTPLGLLMDRFGLPGTFWFAFVLLLIVAQAIYYYVKWKSGEE